MTSANRISANIEALGSAHTMHETEVELSPENGIRVKFNEIGSIVESHIANFELPEQWKDYSELITKIKNVGSKVITIEIAIVCPASRLSQKLEIQAGQIGQLNFKLHEIPLCEGNDISWKVDSLRLTSNDEAQIDLLSIELFKGQKEEQALVDEYGQRIHAEWESKINNGDELKAQIQNEVEIVANRKPNHSLSKHKAWNGKKFNGSGHFKLAKTSSGLWWFMDPEGYPFWSLGVGGVKLSESDYSTKLKGREQLFESLEISEKEAEAKNADSINHFHKNMLRSHSSSSEYHKYLNNLLCYAGINTLGASSSDEIEDTPFILTIETNTDNNLNLASGIPDVFNENWEKHISEIFENTIPKYKNNASLLGYLIDEKINWSKPRLLDAESNTKLKSEWRDFIKSRYDSLEAFNESWILDYNSWEQLPHMAQSSIPRGKPSATNDVDDFIVFYAKKYFDVIYNKLNSLDDKHLYFGCGIGPQLPNTKLLQLLGDYIDVVCFQCGDEVFEIDKLEKIHKNSTRPLMLIGYQAPLISEQQPQAIHQNYTEQERKEIITDTAQTLLNLPYVLGFHLHRLVDYPVSGSFKEGKQGNIGLLSITGKSYQEMLSSTRGISSNIYKIRKL